MYQTLILLGIICIIGAAVGGGLTAFGVEVPTLSGFRIVALFAIGGVLVLSGIGVRPKPPPPPPAGISVVTNPVGPQVTNSCPVNVPVSGYLTTTGGDGPVTVRLEVTWDNGATQYSQPLTVMVDGANTYPFHDIWLVTGPAGGNFEYVVDSPISDGSTAQPFSVSC
jgi:hypothetical protein